MNRETILVVEDETLVGLELKEDLERLGYFVPEVVESGDGVVPAVARYQPDLLLMDVRLRGDMDGIEAAYQTKAEFDLPIIYLTAYSDTDTLKRAALTGPDGFLLKPFDERELAANVQIALSRARSDEPLRRELRGAISLADALDEPAIIADIDDHVAHANKAAATLLGFSDSSRLVRFELSRVLDIPRPRASSTIASIEPLCRSDGRRYGSLVLFGAMERRSRRILQDSAAQANKALINFLPASNACGADYRVAGFLDPCLSGSGDFFDVFDAGSGKTGFYAIDVMGHGVISTLMAFNLREMLPTLGKGAGRKIPEPSEVIRSLYRRYFARGDSPVGTTYFTISYGTIDTATGEYAIARGGYTPALHLEAGGRLHVHYTQGSAVGIMPDAEIKEARGVLSPGDRLLLVSDGLLSAFGEDCRLEEALERLSAFMDGMRASSLESLVKAFQKKSRDFATDRTTEDDVSLLVIERR